MSRRLDLSSVENCACFNVRRAARVITQFFDAEVGRHGIQPTQSPILNALRAREGWSMAQLSDFLGMERTTLVRNLRPLQRDGLVRVSGGGRGGRVAIEITGKGRKLVARILPAWRAAQERVVATLGEDRWAAIIDDLRQVAEKLKNQ